MSAGPPERHGHPPRKGTSAGHPGARPAGDGRPFVPARPPSVRIRISAADSVNLVPMREEEGAVTFEVHAVAGAHREGVVDVHGGAVRIAVRAAPEKGRANEAVREVLARFAGVRKSAVAFVSGETSRTKRVRIEGVTAEMIRRRLLAAMGSVD